MLPSILIRKDFKQAFAYFIRALHFHDLHSITDGFFMPSFVSRNEHRIPTSWKDFDFFSYHFILISVIFLFFSYYWIFSYKKLHGVIFYFLKYHDDIERAIEIIPRYTGCTWTQNKIFFHCVVGSWASSRFDRIFIGIAPASLKEEFFGIVVHELIHINASSITKKKVEHTISQWDLADELATTMLTRKVQRDIFQISENEIQKPSIVFDELLSIHDLETLERNITHVESFESLVVYCAYTLLKK